MGIKVLCQCEKNEDLLEWVRLSEAMGEEAALDILDVDYDELMETQSEIESACQAVIHYPSLLAEGHDLPPLGDSKRAADDERTSAKTQIQYSKNGPFDNRFGPGFKRDNRRF